MNWKKRFVSQKLNVKFTLVIILFMVIPIGILAGILFYNMEKNVVSENTGYMEYTMERNKDAVATKINSINMSTQFFLSDEPLLEMLKARGQQPQTAVVGSHGLVCALRPANRRHSLVVDLLPAGALVRSAAQ